MPNERQVTKALTKFELIGTCTTDELADQQFEGNQIHFTNCEQIEEMTVTIVRH